MAKKKRKRKNPAAQMLGALGGSARWDKIPKRKRPAIMRAVRARRTEKEALDA